MQACHHRKFPFTERRRLALAPKLSCPGDIIVAIYADSGGVPYVLRPYRGGGFKLVGACYVDGEMPGQGRDLEEWYAQGNSDVFPKF